MREHVLGSCLPDSRVGSLSRREYTKKGELVSDGRKKTVSVRVDLCRACDDGDGVIIRFSNLLREPGGETRCILEKYHALHPLPPFLTCPVQPDPLVDMCG